MSAINPPFGYDPSQLLVNDVNAALESKEGFNLDSDAGLQLVQRFRELTMKGECSPNQLALKLLSNMNDNLNKICDKYEASTLDNLPKPKHTH